MKTQYTKSRGPITPLYLDSLFKDAAELVIRKKEASIFLLMINFKIDYFRAQKILNQLEKHNVIYTDPELVQRKVLISEKELSSLISKLNGYSIFFQNDSRVDVNTPSEKYLSLDDLMQRSSLVNNKWPDYIPDAEIENYLQNVYTLYNCTINIQENTPYKWILCILRPYVYEWACKFGNVSVSSVSLALNICPELAYGVICDMADLQFLDQNGAPIVKPYIMSELLIRPIDERFPKDRIPSYNAAEFIENIHEYSEKGTSKMLQYFEANYAKYPTAQDVSLALKLNQNLTNEMCLIFKILEDQNLFVEDWDDLATYCKALLGNKQFQDKYYTSDRNIKEILRTLTLTATKDLPLICTKTSANTSYSPTNYKGVVSGEDFEQYCADLLKYNGYVNIETTKASGDHGVDVLAEKDDISYAIQCKYYSSPVGNGAIQEAYSGKKIYGRDIAVVMTNNTFTNQAVDDANSLGVKLWGMDRISELAKNCPIPERAEEDQGKDAAIEERKAPSVHITACISSGPTAEQEQKNDSKQTYEKPSTEMTTVTESIDTKEKAGKKIGNEIGTAISKRILELFFKS